MEASSSELSSKTVTGRFPWGDLLLLPALRGDPFRRTMVSSLSDKEKSRLVLCSSEDSDTSWCCELKVNLLALRRRPLGFEASLSFSSFLSGSVSRHFWSRDSAMLCELPSFLRRRGVGFAIEHGAEASTFTCLVGGDCDGVFHLLTAFGEITLLVGDMVLEGTRLGAKKFNDGKFLSSLLNLYNAVLDVMMGCDFGVC
ncbi:hypothetical protein PG987_000134 [Apiospora arundinis]